MTPLPEPFATPEELRQRPGCGELEDETASALLAQASAQVRAITQQTISPVDDHTVTLDGDGTSVLDLPEVPVRAVTAVELFGVPLGDEDYRWSQLGWLRRVDHKATAEQHWFDVAWRWRDVPRWGDWPNAEASITVTYSHGWPKDSAQYDIARQVTLRLAQAFATQPSDITQESIGDYSVTYRAQLELSGTDVQMLAGLRR